MTSLAAWVVCSVAAIGVHLFLRAKGTDLIQRTARTRGLRGSLLGCCVLLLGMATWAALELRGQTSRRQLNDIIRKAESATGNEALALELREKLSVIAEDVSLPRTEVTTGCSIDSVEESYEVSQVGDGRAMAIKNLLRVTGHVTAVDAAARVELSVETHHIGETDATVLVVEERDSSGGMVKEHKIQGTPVSVGGVLAFHRFSIKLASPAGRPFVLRMSHELRCKHSRLSTVYASPVHYGVRTPLDYRVTVKWPDGWGYWVAPAQLLTIEGDSFSLSDAPGGWKTESNGSTCSIEGRIDPDATVVLIALKK